MKVMTITASYIRLCWSISATNKHRREKLSCSNFLGFLSRNQTQLHLQKISARNQMLFVFFFNNLFSIIPAVWYKVFPLPTNLVLLEQHAVHFQVKDQQIHGCYRTISRANNAVRKEFLRLQATDREYKQAKRKIKTNSVQQAYLMFSALSYVIFSPAQVTSISVR